VLCVYIGRVRKCVLVCVYVMETISRGGWKKVEGLWWGRMNPASHSGARLWEGLGLRQEPLGVFFSWGHCNPVPSLGVRKYNNYSK